jgi:hypothetical protein
MREMSLPEETAGLVAGRLEGMSVPDLMWLLCRRQATGVLHMSRGPVTKKIYFQDGRIIFSASGDPSDRLGELLLRGGQIKLEHLECAIANLHLGKRLGTLLVEMGHLRPEDLVRGVMTQVREIVLGLFTWEEGIYRFEEGPLPTQEVITLGMKTGELLLQGIRRIRSFTRIRRSVGGPRQRFMLSPGAAEVVEGLELNDGERLLLQRLRRGSASIEALCREIYVSNFEIHQALWALKVLGAVEETDGAGESAAAGTSVEGRLGPEGMIEVLVRLCRAGETGVLHVTRGPAERTFHLREGRCVFATSNNFDDGLIAHLLRRGVISVLDREETARRLLSNKRVGTILLEMGVLDERDLREMVREQLSEIVCDTFCWEEGEYRFVPGELPTIEDIVLETSLEDLITEGIRRVTRWPRVRAGCGGASETPLTLTAGYLDVLDRMTVGPDEWEVVTCLGEPKTVLEICRLTTLGDFRVCQILWALRLLGAVKESPACGTAATPPSPGPVAHPPEDRPAPILADVPGGELETSGTLEGEPPAETAVEPAPVAPEAGPSGEYEAQDAEPAVETEVAAIPVAPPEEGSPELITETWRLTAESFPPPQRSMPPASAEPAPEQAGVEAPCDRAEPAPEPQASPVASGETPPLDSPADATLVLSRAEVEVALGLAPPAGDGADFELAAPGTGTGVPFEETAAADAAGGRDFEIGEPAPEAPEPLAAPSEEPEPSFELADQPGKPKVVLPGRPFQAADDPEAGQTGEIPREVVAEALAAEPTEAAPAEATRVEAAQADAETPADAGPEESLEGLGSDLEAAPSFVPQESLAQAAFALDQGTAGSGAGKNIEVAAPAEIRPEAPEPGSPIADLDRAITRFNQLHRVLYRAIRSEVGAGTVNFIQACRFGLADGHGELFAGSRLLPDGTWDPEGLKRAIRDRHDHEPWSGLERLLDREFEMLRPQIGETRLKALHDQLSELGQTR